MQSRLVLLIDDARALDWREHVHLASTRILAYHRNNSNGLLTWGYKFYDSTQPPCRAAFQQCHFREYTTEQFLTFERQLYQRKRSAKTKTERGNGMTSLRIALSEILTDFQWDQPQLFSPSKTQKTDRSAGNEHLLFLFTNTPVHTHSNESLMKSLFSEGLYEKFVRQHKIKLRWVTTDSSDLRQENVISGRKGENMVILPLFSVTHGPNDVLSRDIILHSLLASKCTSSVATTASFIFSDGNISDDVTLITDLDEDSQQITVKRIHSKNVLSPQILNTNSTFIFLTAQPQSNTSGLFKNALHSKELFEVEYNGTTALVIPHTCSLAVLLTNISPTLSLPKPDVITNVLKTTDFESSLSNIIDSWFLSNPSLGFENVEKKSIVDFSDDFAKMCTKREVSSRKLISFLKERSKQVEGARSSSASSSGANWVRWRLAQYNEKKSKKNTENNVQEIKKEENMKKSEEISKEVEDLKEFESEDELNDFVKATYDELVNQIDIDFGGLDRLVKCVKNFHNIHTSVSLEHIQWDVAGIRERNPSPKNPLHEFLFQVHLIMTSLSVGLFSHDEAIRKVVGFLRAITFEESTVFVRNHLNKVLAPRYKESIHDAVEEIYDEMMIEPPSSDVGEEDEVEDTLSPLKSVQQSSSVYSSETSSIPSLRSEKRILRRFSSNAGDGNKKTIQIQRTKNKEKKSYDQKVKRNLFEKQPRTPRRRKNATPKKRRVPDTPEGKQLNDLIWKRQDRDRRHAKVDKTMPPIEESPMKEVHWEGKKTTLCRSQSFSVRSSPRNFYKRHNSVKFGKCEQSCSPKERFKRYASIVGNENRNELQSLADKTNTAEKTEAKSDIVVVAPNSAVKKRRKIKLFSDFADDNKQAAAEEFDSGVDLVERSRSKARRSIFSDESLEEKVFSSSEMLLRDKSSLIMPSIKRKPLSLERDKKKRRMSEDDGLFAKLPEDSTVDWIEQIEQNAEPSASSAAIITSSLTFKEALAGLTPSRKNRLDTKQTVSPCLSASSIECLERAPILSPYIPKKGR